MWVWKGLGYDNVVELPGGALGALGRRCRQATGTSWGFNGTLRLTGESPGGAPAESVLLASDEQGDPMELYAAAPASSSSPGPAMTYRLAPLRKLRLCLPGAIELLSPPRPSVDCPQGGNFESLAETLKYLAENRGGILTWHVPMVDCRLRADVVDEVCYTPAPLDWPLCVTGTVLGASLEMCVTAPWPPAGGSPSRKGAWTTPSFSAVREEPPIECNGFLLQFLQRGGPPVDPRRLNDSSEETVAEELERWAAKALAARPDTWTTLHVATQPGEVQASLQVPRTASMATAARRQTGDTVVAVAAETEIALEPFELSYGDSHIGSLRRMLEDEVAHVLGISSERVFCSDFIPTSGLRVGGAPKRRHVKNDSIGIRFALLHRELGDLMKMKEGGPKSHPGLPRPNALLPRLSSSQQSSPEKSATRLSFDGVTMQSSFQKEMSATLKSAGRAMAQLGATSTFPGPGSKPGSRGRGAVGGRLAASSSAPTLGTLAAADSSAGSPDLPPDLLLKRLVSLLSEAKHPLRRHPDVFPMLSRFTAPIRTGAVLVIDRNVAAPGQLAEGLKNLMRHTIATKRDLELEPETRMKLRSMRTEIMKLYDGPGGEVLAQQRQLTGLSAKELLDEMEAAVSKPLDLQAALLMLVEHTEKDVEWCLRLRSHKAVERVLSLSRRFNSDRVVVGKGVSVIANLTLNDPGCVDRLIEKNLAPDFIQTLDNFPYEKQIQLNGCQVLRRLYIRAREQASHGPRVVILGRSLGEVWTFKGLERILSNMKLFRDDATIENECLTLLANLGELLYNSGMAGEVFGILEVVMRRHAVHADVLAKGVLIIARLGPSFLQHEHRGVYNIVQAMARHRSSFELQRVGTRAIVALSKEEKALFCCKSGGGVGVIMAAMQGHSKDEQVLRESSRALEKLCPRALAKVIHICGDLASILPPLNWHEYSQGSQWEPVLLDTEWDPQLLKNFRADLVSNPRRWGSSSVGEDEDEEQSTGDGEKPVGGGALATAKGYRRSGFRENFDAADIQWATNLVAKGRSEARERDIRVLKEHGCQADGLRAPGPTAEQLKRLCEVLREGLNQNFGAQDGELLATMLGHFCWCSPAWAKEVIKYQGAHALIAWARAPRFTKGRSPEETALAYPMQRACLGALSSLCMQDDELAGQVLSMGGVALALEFANHIDQRMQQSAMRLLARLIPCAKDESTREQIPREEVWAFILRELKDQDELSRTCAAAAALEIAEDGWLVGEGSRVSDLATNLLHALTLAVSSGSSSAGLPLLLAVGRMLIEGEDEGEAANVLLKCQCRDSHKQDRRQKSLIQLLAFWLPKGVSTGATAADKGASTAAAIALQSLSESEAPLPFREMRELMVCGQSTSAEPALREACKGALLLSVESENQPQQLAHLFATSVGKGRESGERLADIKILRCIAERIVKLLKSAQGQVTDSLLAALKKAEPLVPRDLEDSTAVLQLVEQAVSFAGAVLEEEEPKDEGQEDDSVRTHDPLGDTSCTLPPLGGGGLEGLAAQANMTAPPNLIATAAAAASSVRG